MRMAALLLTGCLVACGGDAEPEARDVTIEEPTLDELREQYRREAEEEINADNAAAIAEELRREIEADEGK